MAKPKARAPRISARDKLRGKESTANSRRSSQGDRGVGLCIPQFEYWLLLHCDDAYGVGTQQQVLKSLKNHLPAYEKTSHFVLRWGRFKLQLSAPPGNFRGTTKASKSSKKISVSVVPQQQSTSSSKRCSTLSVSRTERVKPSGNATASELHRPPTGAAPRDYWKRGKAERPA